MSLRIVPLDLRVANEMVAALHRHHKPVVGHRFSIGCTDGDKLVGAAIVGRPVARLTDYRKVLEVTRLVTDGTKNACSILYAAAARIGREMGYEKIQTFVLDSETGRSCEAAGWEFESLSDGGKGWQSRDGRRDDQPTERKRKFVKHLTRTTSAPPSQDDTAAAKLPKADPNAAAENPK